MKRNEKIEEQKVKDTIILFDTASFKFYELNETMGFIWSLLNKDVSKEEITERLVNEFDVGAERADKDVVKSLEILKEKNLIS